MVGPAVEQCADDADGQAAADAENEQDPQRDEPVPPWPACVAIAQAEPNGECNLYYK